MSFGSFLFVGAYLGYNLVSPFLNQIMTVSVIRKNKEVKLCFQDNIKNDSWSGGVRVSWLFQTISGDHPAFAS